MNTATELVTRTKKFDIYHVYIHITPVLQDLYWQFVKILNSTFGVLMLKIVCPQVFCEKKLTLKPNHVLRSDEKFELKVPTTKLKKT